MPDYDISFLSENVIQLILYRFYSFPLMVLSLIPELQILCFYTGFRCFSRKYLSHGTKNWHPKWIPCAPLAYFSGQKMRIIIVLCNLKNFFSLNFLNQGFYHYQTKSLKSTVFIVYYGCLNHKSIIDQFFKQLTKFLIFQKSHSKT